jgi:hypothetical protein
MKDSIDLYRDLAPFLKELGTTFDVELTGGVYLRFANSGKRGETKWFNLGLAEILTTLCDIADNSTAFAGANEYEEKTWRDLGSLHFTDDAARSFITVQTKPVFTILAKIIHWAKGGTLESYSDNRIDISSASLGLAIENLRNMVENLAPEAISEQINSHHEIKTPDAKRDLDDFREEFGAEISKVNFVQTSL